MRDRKALREVLLVYLAVTVATVLVTRLRSVPAASDYVHLVVGALFLVTAVKLAERERGGLRRFGIDLAGVFAPAEEDERDAATATEAATAAEAATATVAATATATATETATETATATATARQAATATEAATATPPTAATPRRGSATVELLGALRDALPVALRETGVALGVVALVFPPFALAFHFWHGPAHAFVLRWPADLASFALAQVVVVALPEEALFRGFVQTRLSDAFPRTVRLLGTDVSPVALLLQAALFGLMHYAVDLAPERLAVAFPALLFGWLRAWRGGIGAAILVHAMSNVYADILVRGWL